MLLSIILSNVLIVAQPLTSGDVLEPSVLNEVEHALSVAPTNAVPESAAVAAFAAYYATNGLSATEKAIRLVSSQNREGRWTVGTNDVTSAAVRLLRMLSGEDAPSDTHDLHHEPTTHDSP